MPVLTSYSSFLAQLADLPKYEREHLLRRELLLAEDERLRVFYAPFDWVNPRAAVAILGITPGWTQMEIGCRTARRELLSGAAPEDASRVAKQNASFAGSMRSNLVRMLDDLDLAQYLGLNSASDLFGAAGHLLHTSSAIRYPVFKGSQNYTGSNPIPTKSPLLMRIVRELLVPELAAIPQALIVPLGRSVEQVLALLSEEALLPSCRWLAGFPHPSSANGHRVKLFQQNRSSLRDQVRAALAPGGTLARLRTPI